MNYDLKTSTDPSHTEFIARWYSGENCKDSYAAQLRTEEMLGYPVVIKPSNGFYSTGVTKICGAASFAHAWAQTKRACRLFKKLHGHSEIIIEEYIEGKECAIDGFVKDGKIYSLLFHMKYPDLTGPYFHETAYITSPFCSAKGSVFSRILEDVITLSGLDMSPFHAEFRITPRGKIYLLEIGPRLSGIGVTGQIMLDICCHIDGYETLHHLNDGKVLSYKPRGIGLEYDFCSSRNGILTSVTRGMQLGLLHL
ncbi:ATP-grasp domain-containing protein [Xenorhabdus ishibashii]|uniref:Carbamoyl-phosphate synthase small chain n=1 Tax=Xenorhabdus ishibashii TaxID=1034471 RepID=A0A2D0KE39_9GAMM|nr:ATP-grasp domain-containing protein [Xenorhabdus ishibashii]PHM61686.1 Carbamoyl-phosphate synthase small chain [Xenorhabdus ishibashii]